MLARTAVVVSMLAGLLVPGAASADPPPRCVESPVDTVGAHVEVGDEEVHVPAISNARLCAVVWPPVGESAPVEFTVYPWGCAFPCFTLVVEEGDWMVVSTRVVAYLTYEVDGVPNYVPLADVPIGAHVYNPNPVCVAVGNPIPECPAGSIAVPVQAPVL